MLSETHVNLYFDEEKIRLTVLTNICRILIRRGYMSLDKYSLKKDEKDTSIVQKHSTKDIINNSSFMSFIGKQSDNGQYKIPLDKNYEDAGTTKDFDGSCVIVKLIPQVVKDITNSPIINDFLKTNLKYHKIIVFDGMSDKVHIALSKKKNVEVFSRDYLMIDLMSHDCAPIKCELITDDDIKHIINPRIPYIHLNDPLVKYYNGKKKQILRITRTSLNNSEEIGYRRIGDYKAVFN